jgi:aldehyde dehydrogenase (NAD+)
MENSSDIARLFGAQQAAALASVQASSLAERKAALARFQAAFDRHRAALVAAVGRDMAKPETEAMIWEMLPIQAEISHARRHLRRWMRGQGAWPTLSTLGTSARVRPEPRGLALIIAPWNFPVLLSLGPVISALAAGNRVVLKPSEATPETSKALAAMLAEAFPPEEVAVVQGGAEVSQALLDLPFDHIFFTGGTEIGRLVMAKAARTLASVTLELGGKSPTIIGPGADIAKAARWVVWGRMSNAGQTCVAPDHVFVPRALFDGFAEALRTEIAVRYGSDTAAQKVSRDFGRIVNDRHFARVAGLLEDARAKGASVLAGGEVDAAERFIAPTVLTDTSAGMAVSQEEIFGPLLPLIAYDDVTEVLTRINAAPRPLALYIFDKDRAFVDRMIGATRSGSVGVNLSVIQFIHANLPFGGIGASGQGTAHGFAGFAAFSHMRPVLTNRLSALPMLFPPYGTFVRRVVAVFGRLLRL